MRALAFYLPQFHPIPENDRWWGRGFTEWTNVTRAQPRFRGHHQPHLPADLGFYDLRLPEVREAQAELAAEHGVGGFCYYHYWFNGRRLLERPFDEVLASGRPSLPFCLCWANENWTRRWDGQEREVLIAQDYAAYDAAAHARWLAAAFADPRYVRVEGRPLFLLYRADALPGVERVVETWKETVAGLGLPEPFVCAVRSPGSSLGAAQLLEVGFDAACDFQPTGGRPRVAAAAGAAPPTSVYRRVLGDAAVASLAARRSRPRVFAYDQVAHAAMANLPREGTVFPCVIPGWDNSARRRQGAVVIQNDDPAAYRAWLERAARWVHERQPPERRIVFINAWNEWAEGCHLEPDQRHGRAFLEATREALRGFGDGAG